MSLEEISFKNKIFYYEKELRSGDFSKLSKWERRGLKRYGITRRVSRARGGFESVLTDRAKRVLENGRPDTRPL